MVMTAPQIAWFAQRRRKRRTPNWGAIDVLGLLAKGADGFWITPSLTESYQNVGGNPVTATGQTVGMSFDKRTWLNQPLSAILAGAPNVLAGTWTMGVSGGTGTATESPAGQLNLTGDGTNAAIADISFPTVAGATYRLDCTLAGSGIGVRIGTTQGGTNLADDSLPLASTRSVHIEAAGTTTWLRFYKTSAVLSTITSVTIKRVPGNHGVQSSTSLKPKLQFDGARPVLRADGADDSLRIPMAPSTSGMIGGRVAVPATISALQTLIGGTVGTSRCFLAFNTAGRLCAGLGTDAETVIIGTGDLRGSKLCVWLVWDGVSVSLYQDGRVVYSAAQNGAPGADVLRLFATNNGGTAGNFGAMDVYHAMAVKGYVPTDAEIAAASAFLNRA